MAQSKNIVDTAIAAGNFTFAPTDEAFKKLATGAWDALLKRTSGSPIFTRGRR